MAIKQHGAQVFLTTQQHVLLDTSTGDYDVNSLTISVRDKNGNLFDLRTFARKSSNIDFFYKTFAVARL